MSVLRCPLIVQASLETEGFGAALTVYIPHNPVGMPVAGNSTAGDYQLALQSLTNEAKP
jgi:hypothetical protein